MGVVTYEMEVATTIPAAKMFKAFVLDGSTLIAKILPQAIKSIDILEGDGGAGTIKQINFGEGNVYKLQYHDTNFYFLIHTFRSNVSLICYVLQLANSSVQRRGQMLWTMRI